jgi:hypothetical protein
VASYSEAGTLSHSAPAGFEFETGLKRSGDGGALAFLAPI